MTNEQQDVERTRDELKRVGNNGIVATLQHVAHELHLLNTLLGAGMGAVMHEFRTAEDEGMDAPDEGMVLNSELMENLSNMHSTLAVAICTIAAVRNNATSCCEEFHARKGASIEQALSDVLRRHPDFLGNEAARLAVQMRDTSPMTDLRQQLNSLLRQEESDD